MQDFSRIAGNRCLGLGSKIPPYMDLVQPGGLLHLMSSQLLPPAEAPNPILTESDVVEPPLPPVSEKTPASNAVTAAAAPSPSNGQPKALACLFVSCFALLFATLVLL